MKTLLFSADHSPTEINKEIYFSGQDIDTYKTLIKETNQDVIEKEGL